MLAFTRLQAGQFRNLLRKSVLTACARASAPAVLLEGTPDGLRLVCGHGDLALTRRVPGPGAAVRIALPLSALEACAGTTDAPVDVQAEDGTVWLRWQQGRLPCQQRFDSARADLHQPALAVPASWQESPPGLLEALAQATRSAATGAGRYALDHLLLDGASATITATDGRHLLVQQGWAFPWKGQLLVPKLPVFGCRELAGAGPVRVGQTATQVVLEVGPWTLHLPVLKDGRFPPVASVIPRPESLPTVLHLAPEDAAFLAEVVPQLPGAGDPDAPVTLDIGPTVAVRARAAGQPQATEVLLVRSHGTGPPVRLALHRDLLARALALGLTTLQIAAPDKPVLAQDAARQFVAMPLAPEASVPPAPDVLRLSSAAPTPATASRPARPIPPVETSPLPPRTTLMPSRALTNGNGPTPVPEPLPAKTSGYAAVLAEAQALQSLLRDGLGRTNQLLTALKQHRRQAKAVQSSLLALRELQTVDA